MFITMSISKIVTELRRERARIDQAIAAIESISSTTRRRGTPAGASGVKHRPHRMSAAARRKIAAAQRARWAAWRKRTKAT
jgi:hypothetical protein